MKRSDDSNVVAFSPTVCCFFSLKQPASAVALVLIIVNTCSVPVIQSVLATQRSAITIAAPKIYISTTTTKTNKVITIEKETHKTTDSKENIARHYQSV